MPVIVWIFVVYLIIVAALAFWSRKKSQTISGCFIGGKKLPPRVVAFRTNCGVISNYVSIQIFKLRPPSTASICPVT